MPEEVGGAHRFGVREQAEYQQHTDHQEPDDDGDLDGREPELELAEVADLREVDGREEDHEHEGHDHCGTPGSQPLTMPAAPVISAPSTMISMNQ